MSRGLSRQQLRLLGLAVAVSRLRHKVPQACQPMLDRDGKTLVVKGVQPDLTTPLAAHVVGGCGLQPRLSGWPKYELETTPVAKNRRSSISRAIGSLRRRGLVVHKPYGPIDIYGPGRGFVLTQAGLDIGLRHELEIPGLARLVWLTDGELVWWGGRKWEFTRHPRWKLRGFLASPELSG